MCWGGGGGGASATVDSRTIQGSCSNHKKVVSLEFKNVHRAEHFGLYSACGPSDSKFH